MIASCNKQVASAPWRLMRGRLLADGVLIDELQHAEPRKRLWNSDPGMAGLVRRRETGSVAVR